MRAVQYRRKSRETSTRKEQDTGGQVTTTWHFAVTNFIVTKWGGVENAGVVVVWPPLLTAGEENPGRTEHLLGLGLALLGEEHGVDVGEDTTGSDGDAAKELVQLLVVADGELHVAGHDAVLLVVTGGVAGQLEDLGGEVLHGGGQVHGGAGTDGLRVEALLEVARDTADGELEASLGGTRDGLGLATLGRGGVDR